MMSVWTGQHPSQAGGRDRSLSLPLHGSLPQTVLDAVSWGSVVVNEGRLALDSDGLGGGPSAEGIWEDFLEEASYRAG